LKMGRVGVAPTYSPL